MIVDAAEQIAERIRERIDAIGEGHGNAGDSPPLKALEIPPSQRPPDPAAPDLREIQSVLAGLLAHAEWADRDLGRPPNSDVTRAKALLTKIDAALDEKQVGAAPHSPEETP